MLIDTHAHVNFNAYRNDADEVIKRTLAAGVFVVNVGSQYSTSRRAVEMTLQYGVYPHTKDISQAVLDNIKASGFNVDDFGVGVYAAIGLHPIQLKAQTIEYQDDEELSPEEIKITGEKFDYAKYLELAKDKKVVAIGEVGLDYHHFDPPRVDERSPRVEAGEGDSIPELKEQQKEIFLQFIKLANEVKKPLMVHCWDAYDDLYEILKNNPAEKKGIIHSFVGGYKTAKKFIELGYKIGLNGVITYSESYDRLIREIPLENMVLETDCPYLTPAPFKGDRNEPQNVQYVAAKIAEIKEISEEEVAEITTQNAKRILDI